MIAATANSTRDMFQQDCFGMTATMRARGYVRNARVQRTDASTAGLKTYVRQLSLVECDGSLRATQTKGQVVDQMIRRRACVGMDKVSDERANVLVACALKGMALPHDALPPLAPAAPSNPTMRPWLPSLEARNEVAVQGLMRAFCDQRDKCLGTAEPIDRLRAVDAVRRALIVAVSRGDKDVAFRAMTLLNEFDATDEDGRPLSSRACESLRELAVALDAKVRPLEYWLAIHHYERCWLSVQRRAILDRGRCTHVA